MCQKKEELSRCSGWAINESVSHIKLYSLKVFGPGAVYIIQEVADGKGLLAIHRLLTVSNKPWQGCY